MASSEILERIMQELKRVQERAEKIRSQEQNAGSDTAAAKAMSAHIEAAVQKIRKLIWDYEQTEHDKSA